ncbi:MAG: TolC family protein [Bacteroidetes bacterium]|nr:TolC family protein [Bacteroidota bacterium]
MLKSFLTILLLFVASISFGQEGTLNLEDCRQIALLHNRKIKMAEEDKLMMSSIYKSAKTQHYPRFGINGGYLRTNRKFSLLQDDLFIPIIPSEAIVNGQFDQTVFYSDPDLMRETFETGEMFGQPYPLTDQNGDYIFQNYAYIPKEEAEVGFENIFIANFGMTQPIYMGGKIRQLNKLAEQGEELFKNKKELTKAEVIIETDKKYWQVISLKEKVKLTTIYKQMIDSLLIDLNNIYDEGIITRNEILKASVKRNEVELKLLKATNGLHLAQMALNQTLGFPLDTTINLSDSITTQNNFGQASGLTQQALENRPEIEMVSSTIKIAQSAEKLMRSRYLPNIGLTANYFFMNPNPYNGFDEEFGGDWNVGVVVNIPLWHWNDKKHTLNAAKHKTNSLKEKYNEAQELITLEVQQALFKCQESEKKVELTRTSLKQSEENLQITQDSFNEGMVNTTDLLEAQTMWQEAYSEFIEAKTEQKLCESELLKATGQLNY